MTYSTNTRVADYLALRIFGRSHDELWGGEGTLASKVTRPALYLEWHC